MVVVPDPGECAGLGAVVGPGRQSTAGLGARTAPHRAWARPAARLLRRGGHQSTDGRGDRLGVTVQAVAANQDTFGFADAGTMTVAVARGVPVRMVANTTPRSPIGVISLPPTVAERPQDPHREVDRRGRWRCLADGPTRRGPAEWCQRRELQHRDDRRRDEGARTAPAAGGACSSASASATTCAPGQKTPR